MTGIESTAVVAGKFLAPFAAKAAKRLSEKATYRWRVEREMRKLCHFGYPHRPVRQWLRRLTPDLLAQPAEQSVPDLALNLDHWLGLRDEKWKNYPYHASQALQLADAAYLAILTTQDASKARQLQEQWAGNRHQEIVARFAELAQENGLRALSDADIAIWLRSRSEERRRTRLSAFAIDMEDAINSIEALTADLPQVAAGSFRVLRGSFGSGKSEMAEEWHKSAITRLSSGRGAPIPVWLYARQIGHEGLEQVIVGQTGLGLFRARGVAAVIDGLDEVDGARAEEIARDARILVASNPLSAVLGTARPGVLPPNDTDHTVEGLHEDAARQLVQRLSGRRHVSWDWTPELVATIRRPFFALAAAALLAAGEAPKGQAELMKSLVEQALSRGSTVNSTASENVYNALLKMSTSLTRTNGLDDGLTFHERQLALSTRLITPTSQSMAKFTLPVFEQWFCAQALLESSDLVDEALASPTTFDRWRWVIAVAILSGRTETADKLIEACLRMNPGAGAWVIDQVSHGWRSKPSSQNAERPDLESISARLLRATRAWIDAIGPLAPLVLPIQDSTGVRIGIATREGWVACGWSDASVTADEIVELPEAATVLSKREPSEWVAVTTLRFPLDSVWPWSLLQDRIAKKILPLLEGTALGALQDSVWQEEVQYRTARIITRNRSVMHPPMDCEGVLAAGAELLQIHPAANSQTFVIDGRRVEDWQITDLLERCDRQSLTVLERLLPVPDVSIEAGDGWIESLYSDRQLQHFSAELLGHACRAYEEAATAVFASFEWSLGHNAYEPMASLGFLILHNSPLRGREYTLGHVEVPAGVFQSYVDEHPGALLASNGRAAVIVSAYQHELTEEVFPRLTREVNDWATRSGLDSPFRRQGWTLEGLTVNGERPVSEMAAKWIYDDLKRLSLASGTFPQLSR